MDRKGIARQCAWQPGEREAAEADLAARAAMNRRSALAAKDAASPSMPQSDELRADEIIAAVRAKLADLRAEMKKGDRNWLNAAMDAAAKHVAERDKALRAEFEAEIAKLRIEFLQQQLDAARGVTRLKAVPPSLIA